MKTAERARARRVIYVDTRGQAPFRYARLLSFRGYELAVTWPVRESPVRRAG